MMSFRDFGSFGFGTQLNITWLLDDVSGGAEGRGVSYMMPCRLSGLYSTIDRRFGMETVCNPTENYGGPASE